MERRARRFTLAAGGVVILIAIATVGGMLAQSTEPNWNKVQPVILELTFPDQATANSRSVTATTEERNDGMKWIAALLSPAAMPKELESHLLPLRASIPVWAIEVNEAVQAQFPNGAPPPSDGFVVKYLIPGYAVQVMETRSHVIVGFHELTEGPSSEDTSQRLAFVAQITKHLLNTRVQPVRPPVVLKHSKEATIGMWSPVIGEEMPNGMISMIPDPAINPFLDIRFKTDGKSVIFEAYKILLPPSDYTKPRFSSTAELPEPSNSGGYRTVPGRE